MFSSRLSLFNSDMIFPSKLLTLVYIILSLFVGTIRSEPVNVALGKPVTAMYTCGTFGRESYNTLTDAQAFVSNRPKRSCVDTRGGKSASYPVKAMVDGKTETWWQSTSRSSTYLYGQALQMEMTRELEAEIDIDLLQEFLAEKIIIQLGDALSPQKVAIHRSVDGISFTPWLYAVSNLDWCSQFFQVTIKAVPTTQTDTTCVGFVADDKPPGDAITFDLSQTPVSLKEWNRVRYLKIKLFDMLFAYPFNLLANTYNHYAIRELTVMAECPCNGQQESCDVNPTSGMFECTCGGNTRGRFCESCQPLFNQFQFEYGKPCNACNCFEHASSCFYQASVEAGGLSLDIDGNSNGGGVCVDCQHNTAGVNCEKCVDLYYRPSGRLQTALDVCVPCNCNSLGSGQNPNTGLIDCLMNDQQNSTEGKLPGDCYCKENVQGSKCDTCKPGFYNLQQSNPDGCTACGCNTQGTVGGSELCASNITGQCICKPNVEGRTCDQCKDGFYNLTNNNTDGCLACDCDIGGALNQVCDKMTGQCTCRSDNIIGRRCDSIRPTYYVPSPHGIFEELEDSFGIIEWKRDPQFAGFSSKGYAVLEQGESLNLLMNVPTNTNLSNAFIFIVTYRGPPSNISIVLPSAGEDSALSLALPACENRWCEANTEITKPLSLLPTANLMTIKVISGQVLLVDKLVAFPVEYLQPEKVLPGTLPAGCDLLKNLLPSVPADNAACQGAIFSLMMFYWQAPLSCNCDITGSVSAICDVNGGQCQCQPGVVDRNCDKCSPEYFGFSSTGCSDCNCDNFSSTCDSVTGQCQCPDNTLGRQCELCIPNHWDWSRTQGCKSCDCNPGGSSNLQCNATTGICSCKTGVEGDKCDTCQDGYTMLGALGCSPCACNEAGSVNSACNKTTGQCLCKNNTSGLKCDSCLAGTFGLADGNSDGCLSCVCMGITTECTSAGIKLSSQPFPLTVQSDNGTVSALEIATADGNSFNISIDMETSEDLTSAIKGSLTAAEPRLYWKMPGSLVSNLLSLYGSRISFTINYVIVEGQPLTDIKALLIDTDGNVFSYPLDHVVQGNNSLHTVVLKEEGWQQEGSTTILSRGEFLKAITTAATMLLPASFGDGKHTTRLSRLEFSSVSDVGLVNPAVEQCVCGDEYSGRSCEQCIRGYKRANASSSDYFGVCVPCECNGHTALCDPDTGVCQDCHDNTGGDSCERCLLGFYEDPVNGIASGCLPCPCNPPRVVNASCHYRDTNVTDGNNVVCDFCQTGYVGPLCDECDLLYNGNPKEINGTCVPCECNDNSDTCDSSTGACNACLYNTTGTNCQECVINFYGNATLQDCKECGCIPSSSNSTVCDTSSGQCPCIYGVGGRMCEECLMGFWGFNNSTFVGCKACGCLEAGSLGIQCNNDTGECNCRPNTEGSLCDTCVNGFYGLPLSPCQACLCDTTGTVPGSTCNSTTGQCLCQPGVTGRQCDQCSPFFVNFTTAGCDECGQCHKSLGADVDKLLVFAKDLSNLTLGVFDVQKEDERLQNLTMRLNTSLNALGITDSSATSVSDIINNVTSLQTNLVASFGSTENKVSLLLTSAKDAKARSTVESTRHADFADRASNLTVDMNAFEQEANVNMLYLRQYNATASQYQSQGRNANETTLTFQEELDSAQSLLSQAQNTTSMESTNAVINSQAEEISTIDRSISVLNSGFDGRLLTVSSLRSTLYTMSISTSSVEYLLGEAAVFKSQAEDLENAVDELLRRTEEKNSDSQAALSAARTSAGNTDRVYSRSAFSVMTGAEYLPFPSGVTNYENGVSRLDSLMSSLPLLIDRVGESVVQSESYVDSLATSLLALNSTYQNSSSVGRDAVAAIKNFEQVVIDLDEANSKAETASVLIDSVRGNVSGEAFARLQQEYMTEKNNSEALRSQIMQHDYQPQVIQNSIATAIARLDNENAQWTQADSQITAMNAAVQTLNAQTQDNTLSEQIAVTTSRLEETLSTVQTVSISAANQKEVLDQKQAEFSLLEGEITGSQSLDLALRQRLSSHQTRFGEFQANLTVASSLSQNVAQSTKDISDKIKLLESKLANAENLLSRLRQPLTFDGSLGLKIDNPVAGTAHVSDAVEFDLRKAANVSNGIVFFVENPTTAAELEVGISNNKIFFEFNTGSQNVRITNPAVICDGCWSRIYAHRYADIGHLTVTRLSTGGIASESSSGQPSGNSRTITLGPDLYIGSLPDSLQTNKVLNRTFQGCLHKVKYQGQSLSLYTTAVNDGQTAKCCQAPPSLPSSPTTEGVSFNGFGYLLLQSGDNKISEVRHLEMEFRTFTLDSTLLKVISADGRTFFTFYLEAGYVVWETQTGGILYRLKSKMAVSTGQWVQLIADGQPTQLVLTVKYVNDSGDPSETRLDINFFVLTALDGRNWIIGSALDPTTQGYTISDGNFAGCMRNMEITTSSSTQYQLSFTENVVTVSGVNNDGCYESVINGLLFTSELSAVQLSSIDQVQQLRYLEFDVVTQLPNGVLLYLNAAGSLRFLYMAIFGGNVMLAYRTDNTATVISYGKYISDGQLHTIQLDCSSLRVLLKVDGVSFEESTVTLNVNFLTFPASAFVYLGHLPDRVQLEPEFPVQNSLIGGIHRLSLNQQPVAFSQAKMVEFRDVSLSGIPAPAGTTPSPPVTTDPPLITCATSLPPSFLSLNEGFVISGENAINWNNLAPGQNLNQYLDTSFVMNIHFAAYKADGVLLYVADQLSNPQLYFTIYLMNGIPHLRMRTTSNQMYDIQLKRTYSDGQRHQLDVMRINDFAALTVETYKDYINTGGSPNITTQLTIPSTTGIYVGGLGLNELATSSLPEEFKSQPGREHFAGAIYGITFRSDPEQTNLVFSSLDRATYPAIPKDVNYGMSLSGVNSYLGLGQITTNTSLTIEITLTTMSDNGLLLALFKSANSRFIAVDLKDQQLRLHLPSTLPGVTEPEILTLVQSSRLCDGRQHTVKISIHESTASATIDDRVGPSLLIPASHRVQTMVNNQFSVGGITGTTGTLTDELVPSSLAACIISVKVATGNEDQVVFDPTQFASSSAGTSYSCPYSV